MPRAGNPCGTNSNHSVFFFTFKVIYPDHSNGRDEKQSIPESLLICWSLMCILYVSSLPAIHWLDYVPPWRICLMGFL